MYYKNIGHYTILCLITLEIFVSGETLDRKKSKTLFTDSQFYYLAGNVCSDLDYFNVLNISNCQKDFWKAQLPLNSHSNIQKESPAKIRCTTKYSVRFTIAPSTNWQLVVLVPESNNNDEIDIYSVSYQIIEPKKGHGKAYTSSNMNYTLWSTEMIKGSPIYWKRGDKVSLYIEPEHKEYDVDVKFLKHKVDDNISWDALVTWNSRGDDDLCFDIVNFCPESGMQETTVWPEEGPNKLFTNLTLDVVCNIQIKGLYGITKLTYRTPAYIDDTRYHSVPEIPQNVYVEASEDRNETWQVFVSWSSPSVDVERYNITLFTKSQRSQTIDGSNTDVTFREVPGEGYYIVSIQAILGKYSAYTSRQALFPVPGRKLGEVAGRAAALALIASAIVALVLGCFWRRRSRPSVLDLFPSEIKDPKEDDTETVSTGVENADRWEIRSDKLLLHEVIGEGAFGVVRRATLAPRGTNVAVKMLKEFSSVEEVRSFRSEMELMKSVGVHPHIVSLVGCCSGRRPFIIAEYCSRGDLLTYLRCTWDVMVSKRNAKNFNNNIDISDYKNDYFKARTQTENSRFVVNKMYELQEMCDEDLTFIDLLSFCRQIAMGMEFLSANRVVHRDLAARNILVTENRTLKITDFGLSRDVYQDNQYKQKGNGKMPVKWMALESLTRRVYTTQSDVWSFGVVLWEVATIGASPYASIPTTKLLRLLRAGYRMEQPANCTLQLYDVMLSCWRTNPRDRPTFAELHARLDELLEGASANHYLPLEVDPLDAPPTPKHHRYISKLIRGKRKWTRGESYERPLHPSQSNHYSSPPVVHSKGSAT